MLVLVADFSETYIRQCECLHVLVPKGAGDDEKYQGH
jgi:hypothetical protein